MCQGSKGPRDSPNGLSSLLPKPGMLTPSLRGKGRSIKPGIQSLEFQFQKLNLWYQRVERVKVSFFSFSFLAVKLLRKARLSQRKSHCIRKHCKIRKISDKNRKKREPTGAQNGRSGKLKERQRHISGHTKAKNGYSLTTTHRIALSLTSRQLHQPSPSRATDTEPQRASCFSISRWVGWKWLVMSRGWLLLGLEGGVRELWWM